MTRTPISTDRTVRPGGAYSQAIVANGFVYTSGLGPQDPATGELAGDTIEAQTAQVLTNLGALLAEAGSGWEHVVKSTVHLQHLKRDFAGFNAVYAELVPQPYPVRTTVGSDLADILVEIDVVAVIPGG